MLLCWKWFPTTSQSWHNKKYFMLDVFCSVGSQHGLDLRVTKNIFCLHFLLNLKMVPFWSQSNYFLSTFFKCHTFLAVPSWSVPFPSGGSLLGAFWHISDVIISTIKSLLSLLSHFKLLMIPLLPFKLPMIPLLPLMVGLELDNNLTVASYLSLFEQKST